METWWSFDFEVVCNRKPFYAVKNRSLADRKRLVTWQHRIRCVREVHEPDCFSQGPNDCLAKRQLNGQRQKPVIKNHVFATWPPNLFREKQLNGMYSNSRNKCLIIKQNTTLLLYFPRSTREFCWRHRNHWTDHETGFWIFVFSHVQSSGGRHVVDKNPGRDFIQRDNPSSKIVHSCAL